MSYKCQANRIFLAYGLAQTCSHCSHWTSLFIKRIPYCGERMCSLYHLLGHRHCPWETLSFSVTDALPVSEVWVDAIRLDMPRSLHRTITKSEIPSWLAETATENRQDQSRRCLLRIIWLTVCVKQSSCNVAADVVADIVRAFGLGEMQEHSSHCYSWSVCEGDSGFGIPRAYYFGKYPRMNLSWSRKDGTIETSALCVAKESNVETLKQLLDHDIMQLLVHHELMLLFFCAVMFSKQIDEQQEKIKQQVKEVEVRTGYHTWQSRSETAALGDLTSLSAKMSGCETKNASLLRKIRVVLEVTDSIGQHISSPNQRRHGRSDEAGLETLDFHLTSLIQRAKMQRVDAEVYMQRTKAQLTAVGDSLQSSPATELYGHKTDVPAWPFGYIAVSYYRAKRHHYHPRTRQGLSASHSCRATRFVEYEVSRHRHHVLSSRDVCSLAV